MFFNFLKQRGFLDLHTTAGSQTVEPLATTNNATVHCFLLCFPPLPFFHFSASPFCGSVLKNNPSSSIFCTPSSERPFTSSGNLSIYALTVVMSTSPASPDITLVASRITYVVLKDSSHPLEAWSPSFCLPQVHCFIQFVKFSLMNSLPVTFKTGIVFAKLLFTFYYRCSRCFSNIINFSNICTSDRRIAFLVIEQFCFFS